MDCRGDSTRSKPR